MKHKNANKKNRRLQYLGCILLALGIALLILLDSIAGMPILVTWISGAVSMVVGVLLITQPTVADIISTLLSQ